jgi:hypothetical protein
VTAANRDANPERKPVGHPPEVRQVYPSASGQEGEKGMEGKMEMGKKGNEYIFVWLSL